MHYCWFPLFVRASMQPLASRNMWYTWTVLSRSIRFLQSHGSGITFCEIHLLLVNQERTVIKSISRWINLKPKFHARRRPWQTAPNSEILLEVQTPKLHSNPPAPANPGLPNKLPFIFNFIKGSSGEFHLIILGIPILIFFVRQTKKKNFVALSYFFVWSNVESKIDCQKYARS